MFSTRHLPGILCLLLAGCAARELPRADGRLDVRGQVSLDGAALDAAEITFKSAKDAAMGEEFIAAINRGEFRIEIPPGNYRIEVRQFVPTSNSPRLDDTPSPPQQVIPAQYNDKSELKAEVNKEHRTLEFSLVSPAKK